MKVKFMGADGALTEASLSANMYEAASSARVTFGAYLASNFKTDETKYGSVLDQMMASAGLFSKDDPSKGIHAATVEAAMNGTCDSQYKAQGSTNVEDVAPASRILFPAAILRMIENKLYANRDSEIALFDSFIAQKETIAGKRFEYPVLDFTRPERSRSSRISQLSEPNLMMVLTTSDKAGNIPVYSLGLQISDEAARSSTIDFVSLSLARQAEVEAAERLDECIYAMVNGDVDLGIAALPTVKVNTFDSSITEAGKITHKAWLKWLAAKRRTTSITVVMMTLDTFLKVEAREGKPLKETDSTSAPFNQRPDVIPTLINLNIQGVRVYLVEPTVIPDDTIVGFDPRYAMRKITNSEAQYKAAQQLVMRKASEMRWDWGNIVHRLYDEAWSVLSLTV